MAFWLVCLWDFDIFMSNTSRDNGYWIVTFLFTVVFRFLFYSIEKTVCIFMQTVPLISDAAVFRFLHSHKTGLHLNLAEKSLNHILRVLISREKHLKDISSSPDFSSSPQTPSRNFSLPVAHVLGSLSQWRDRNGLTPFSLSMLLVNLYPECNAEVYFNRKNSVFTKVFMYFH